MISRCIVAMINEHKMMKDDVDLVRAPE